MYKKVSESQKIEILEAFSNGEKIKNLSLKYGFSIPTISRQLKNLLGEKKFFHIKNEKLKKNTNNSHSENHEKIEIIKGENYNNQEKELDHSSPENSIIKNNEEFYEISPLIEDVNLDQQKDITSKPIDTFNFPKLAYMIVDKKIELEVKILKEYSEWQFLPQIDLNRKTIKIYFDLKNAKQNCNKDQKVIKVPNTNVFKIVKPILLDRGISRILTDDELIAL